MRPLRRKLLVTTLCLAVSVFLQAGVSHAHSGGSGTKVKVEVEAELQPCGAVAPATSPCDPAGTPPEPGAEGTAKHKKETRNGVVKKDEFKGSVMIPVSPTSALGIVDQASAENADIRLILTHPATATTSAADFAECSLVFEEIETEDGVDLAEFKVDVRMKKGALQEKKGTCDVTTVDATGAVTTAPGVPDAQADDVATATLVKNPADRTMDVDFLQGTFAGK